MALLSTPTSQTLVNTAQLAATLARREKGYENQISQQIPLFYWLKRKGSYKPVNGGTQIEWAVEYGQDTNEESYKGFDTLALEPSDNVTIAKADWKMAYKPIVISGEDMMKNTGERIFDLLEQKEQNALESLQQQFNERFYEDGTGNNSKRITGLKAICASNPATGTLFGIDRAKASWWRNQYKDTNAVYYASSTDNMTPAMLDLWMYCGRVASGGKKNRYPDLGLCTETYYKHYHQILQKDQRFSNTDAADAGFTNLTFMGMTLIPDYDCPADANTYAQAYFLNSRFLKLVYHPQRNFTTTAKESLITSNQDGFVSLVLWMGELICTNCAKQGINYGVKSS